MIKRIIKHMTNILNIYRFTKIVDSSAGQIGQMLKSSKFDRSGRKLYMWVSTAYAKDAFRQKYPKNTYNQIEDICEQAINQKYLQRRISIPEALVVAGEEEEIEQVRVLAKGHELLDKAWIFPIGLWSTWWDKYGVFLVGFGIGGLFVGLIQIIKVIIGTF